MVSPGPAKLNSVTVDWNLMEHLAEDMGIPHETLKTPLVKNKSEGIHTHVVLHLCEDGGVRWAG